MEADVSFLPYLLLGFVTLMAGAQVWAFWRAKRQQGKPAPDFADLVPSTLVSAPRLLFYFYGERCGPCRAMAPLTDRLADAYAYFIKVDVAEHPEAARRFGVMGTPTFVLVERGKVGRVILGGTTEATLRGLLE
jgi:thioredoxin 1